MISRYYIYNLQIGVLKFNGLTSKIDLSTRNMVQKPL